MDSLGTGSLAHTYTHLFCRCVRTSVSACVFPVFSHNVCWVRTCVVTRPGHLRGIWGGAALCWKRGRRGERGMKKAVKNVICSFLLLITDTLQETFSALSLCASNSSCHLLVSESHNWQNEYEKNKIKYFVCAIFEALLTVRNWYLFAVKGSYVESHYTI